MLNHPNVITLHEYIHDQHNTRVYLVQELAEKGQILNYDYVNKKFYNPRAQNQSNFTESEIRKMMREIIKGLDYLHSNGILHRDIKPQNILVSADDKIKLSDFGLSTNYEYQSEISPQIGTNQFMPPEYFKGCYKKNSSRINLICLLKQGDVWALGITLFALMYLKIPFNDDNWT